MIYPVFCAIIYQLYGKENEMKYLKQFLIIMLFSFIGEGLNYIIPLPVPASIYGLILLFIALMTGVVKLHHIKETGQLLIDIMPIMFIPAGVGLITSWGVLKAQIIPIVVIIIFSTVLEMGVSGKVTQYVIKRGEK